MKFSEMMAAFETYSGQLNGIVDNAQLAIWFNEAQLDLAYDFGKIKVKDYAQEPQAESYQLPDDCLFLVSGTYERNPDGTIRFLTDDKTVAYRSVPEHFTGADADQVSELPGPVHYLMVIFAVSRYWDQESEGDGEESAFATKWLNYYYSGKNLAKARLQTGSIAVDHWEVV